MLYLITAIIFGALFSIVFRVCQNLHINCPQVILFNYILAAIITWIPIVFSASSGKTVISDYSLHGITWLFASIQGVLFMLGFIIMDQSTWRNGVALTTVAARASLVLPLIFSYLFLGQSEPRWLPVILELAAVSIIIIPDRSQQHEVHKRSEKERRKLAILSIAGVFLCYGISDFGVKVSQHSVEVQLEQGAAIEPALSSLMGVIFIAAAIASLVYCMVSGAFKESPLSWKAMLGGLVLGVVNILCTSSSLRALSTISTSIYYPVYNIGIVLVATIAGVLFFKEKIRWIQIGGMILAVGAIILFFI